MVALKVSIMADLFNYQLTLEGISVKQEPIHLPGPYSPDMALCGHDLCGDMSLGYDDAKQTTLKATCPQCIQLVEFAKRISKRMYEKI